MKKNILIIGGTSGLGLSLAKKYVDIGHTLFVTGRKKSTAVGMEYLHFPISENSEELRKSITTLTTKLPAIHTLVYCAGSAENGHIDTLSDEHILEMINVGLATPALLVQRLKNNPGKPLKVMLVTSSAHYTPREHEPVYCAVKAGLGMLGASLALDSELGKVVVVAPSGMNTPFWKEGKDVTGYLDSDWVADQIIATSGGMFKYRYVKILREPPRVEIVETR